MFEKPAIEFEGIKTWINSPPLTLQKLRGKAILLDFWTYSCVNCIRTLPALKAMHEKYSKKGLVIVGVHTPEFGFEKDLKNVQAAVDKHGIKYPVALDSDNATWQLYGNRYWPRATLINQEGKIVMEHIGEAGYDEIEERIAELLKIHTDVPEEEREFALIPITPEIYTGSLRSGGFGSSQVCALDGSCDVHVDQGEHQRDVVYLSGEWKQEPERIVHIQNKEGYVLLKYSARVVNAVMLPASGKKFTAEILLDGKPLQKSQAGKDIKFAGKKSFVEVDHADMHELVNTKTVETHEIKIVTNSPEFTLYTFTFG